jgi:hypothetical protein
MYLVNLRLLGFKAVRQITMLQTFCRLLILHTVDLWFQCAVGFEKSCSYDCYLGTLEAFLHLIHVLRAAFYNTCRTDTCLATIFFILTPAHPSASILSLHYDPAASLALHQVHFPLFFVIGLGTMP